VSPENSAEIDPDRIPSEYKKLKNWAVCRVVKSKMRVYNSTGKIPIIEAASSSLVDFDTALATIATSEEDFKLAFIKSFGCEIQVIDDEYMLSTVEIFKTAGPHDVIVTRGHVKHTKQEDTEEKDPLETDFDEDGISNERQETARLEALNILQNDNPIKKIKDTVSKIHSGDCDFQELMCIALASQSCINTSGIHPSLHGPTGSGKSHAAKSHTHCLRKKHKRESTMSAKAAYYNELKPGCLIFSDDSEPNEDLEQTIKRATTNFQETTVHMTVVDGKGEPHTIPPRILWLFTSVSNNGSDQFSDRQVKCYTINTELHKKSACEKQLEEAQSGKFGLTDVDDDVLVCRYIYDEIKSKLLRVKIPYANKIKFATSGNLRNTQRLLDMIKGYAVMFHMQREKDTDGSILANREDFKMASALFNTR
jgi:hypothetical protein